MLSALLLSLSFSVVLFPPTPGSAGGSSSSSGGDDTGGDGGSGFRSLFSPETASRVLTYTAAIAAMLSLSTVVFSTQIIVIMTVCISPGDVQDHFEKQVVLGCHACVEEGGGWGSNLPTYSFTILHCLDNNLRLVKGGGCRPGSRTVTRGAEWPGGQGAASQLQCDPYRAVNPFATATQTPLLADAAVAAAAAAALYPRRWEFMNQVNGYFYGK